MNNLKDFHTAGLMELNFLSKLSSEINPVICEPTKVICLNIVSTVFGNLLCKQRNNHHFWSRRLHSSSLTPNLYLVEAESFLRIRAESDLNPMTRRKIVYVVLFSRRS
jgi:hypothetical protein